MAGIYLHIPFCHYKCHYCNFYTLASFKYKDEFIPALIQEIVQRKEEFKDEIVDTIYFGGGTPSVLVDEEIARILDHIREHYNVAPQAEISLEANPEDLSRCYTRELFDVGINRLSIGTQAFDERILEKLNRDHKVKHSLNAVKYAKESGIQNISIDLIYGIPGLSDSFWEESLDKAFALDVDHISAYHLTVEPGTALKKLIEKKKYPMPDDQISMEQFDVLMSKMNEHGYEHYEISNFARNKKYSQHNSSYWFHKPYLGFGPSAHSFDLNERRWNVKNLKGYFEGVKNKAGFFEIEKLSLDDRYNEFVMLGLRTIWGVNLKTLKELFGDNLHQYFLESIKPHLEISYVKEISGSMCLTESGKKFADGIASDCFSGV